MSNSEQSFYNRYWGRGGARSCDAPVHHVSDGENFLKKFSGYYTGTGKGRALLDFGCGEGDLLAQAGTVGGFNRAVGIDVSDHVVDIARKKHPELEFLVSSGANFPFPENAFDIVQSISVLEHLVDLQGTLGEVARVLKPGGYFICYTTDFNWLKQTLIAMFCWDKYFDPLSPHIRYLKRGSLKRILESVGLQEVHYSWNCSYFGIMPQGMHHVSQKAGSPIR